MKSRDFCYWLQGWFELNKTTDHRNGASAETLQVIEKHLAMVFVHEIDPSFPHSQQEALDSAHAKIDLGDEVYLDTKPLLRC